MLAGEGMQFESHLGHVFSLFRGLWSSECVQISFYGPLLGPIFVGGRCGLAAPSMDLDSGAACSFVGGSAWNCMTCCDLGSLGPPVLLFVSYLVGLVPIRVPELR